MKKEITLYLRPDDVHIDPIYEIPGYIDSWNYDCLDPFEVGKAEFENLTIKFVRPVYDTNGMLHHSIQEVKDAGAIIDIERMKIALDKLNKELREEYSNQLA